MLLLVLFGILSVVVVVLWIAAHLLVVLTSVLLGLLAYVMARWLTHRQTSALPARSITLSEEKAVPVLNRHRWEPVCIGKQIAGYADEGGHIVWGKTRPVE